MNGAFRNTIAAAQAKTEATGIESLSDKEFTALAFGELLEGIEGAVERGMSKAMSPKHQGALYKAKTVGPWTALGAGAMAALLEAWRRFFGGG